MSQTYAYDVFFVYSAEDKPIVRELAEQLRNDGLRIWLDEWEVKAGDSVALSASQGLIQSRTLVFAISENAYKSEWPALERQTTLFRDLTSSERRFIPLRLDDTKIRDEFVHFAYIDWRRRSFDQYARLLSACSHVEPTAAPTKDPDSSGYLFRTLEGHGKQVNSVAITPEGRWGVSGSSDKIIRVWDLSAGTICATLRGHTGAILSVAIAADGQRVVSCSEDKTVRKWDLKSGPIPSLLKRHGSQVTGIAITANGRKAVSVSLDQTLRVWDLETKNPEFVMPLHSSSFPSSMPRHRNSDRALSRQQIALFEELPLSQLRLADSASLEAWLLHFPARFSAIGTSVAVTPDGLYAVTSSAGTLQLWDLLAGRPVSVLRENPATATFCLAITADGQRAFIASSDNSVQIWDLKEHRISATLEGHTSVVNSVAATPDGRYMVSGSKDRIVKVWDVKSGQVISTFDGHSSDVLSVAITSDGQRVISGSRDGTARVWDLQIHRRNSQAVKATRYTNAKVLLVGDSGVGKSGLAYRLAEDQFVSTVSTDAVWATQMKLPHESERTDIEREIWLWDFAGQADYRLVHQLYMDETAVAVLVFNPQSEDPFEGLGQWDRDLQRAARRPFRKLLVAGRVDRGGLMISQSAVRRFLQERGFSAYMETSALTGVGCKDLRDTIIQNISWDGVPWTSSPSIFRKLKEEIVRLKDEGKVLLRMVELKQQLEIRLPGELFMPEELRSVVGLLAGPGVVWQLEFGDFVLLQPERINSYAAAVIRTVRAHTDEIGCILEEHILAGNLDFLGMQRLSEVEEQIVLRAMHQTLVIHGLCLRERTEHGMLLVFPSYFKRERPELDAHPAVFVSYQFAGALDEIYASLVVRLHHTLAFDKDQLWRFAADFKTPAGKRVGLKMTKKGEGTAELSVYFEAGVPDDIKVTFIRYIHEHLQIKASSVARLRHYVCPHCDTPVENRRTAIERLNRGLHDIVCVNCEQRIPLWDLIEQKFASEEFQSRVQELAEQARASIDSESRELILIGHAFAIAGEAGQIFRPTPNSDWGIDGEIEFKDKDGKASGRRVYLQLKSGDSYLQKRKGDESEVFTVKKARHSKYWQQQSYPVMLVIRTSDGIIRWMNVTEYLNKQSPAKTRRIIFQGEPFTARSLRSLRDRVLEVP
jgi:small GTP-binding protein